MKMAHEGFLEEIQAGARWACQIEKPQEGGGQASWLKGEGIGREWVVHHAWAMPERGLDKAKGQAKNIGGKTQAHGLKFSLPVMARLVCNVRRGNDRRARLGPVRNL